MFHALPCSGKWQLQRGRFAFLARKPQEFVPSKDIDLALKDGVLGTSNKKTGQTFALMLLSPADHVQLSVQNHSALISVTYPSFLQANNPYTYRMAYYVGKDSRDTIESLVANLKSGR